MVVNSFTIFGEQTKVFNSWFAVNVLDVDGGGGVGSSGGGESVKALGKSTELGGIIEESIGRADSGLCILSGLEFLIGSSNGVGGEPDNSFSISSLTLDDKLNGFNDTSSGLGLGDCGRSGNGADVGSKGEAMVEVVFAGNVSAIGGCSKDCSSSVEYEFGADFWDTSDGNEFWLFRLKFSNRSRLDCWFETVGGNGAESEAGVEIDDAGE